MKKLRVTIEGKVYEVLVETVDDHGTAAAATPSSSLASSVMTAAPAQVSAAAAPARAVAGGPSVETLMQQWSLEGRRQIYSSHQVR